MPEVEWTDEMSVGHAELDAQHQMLLELYNRFDAAAAQGRGRRAVTGLLAALFEYTAEHFAAEEEILDAAGYPGLERHRELHRQLVAKLEAFRLDFAAGRRFTADFRNFLAYWWERHILEHDRDYASFLAGRSDRV